MPKFPSPSCSAVALRHLLELLATDDAGSVGTAELANRQACTKPALFPRDQRNLQQFADTAFEFLFRGRALEASLLPRTHEEARACRTLCTAHDRRDRGSHRGNSCPGC